MKGVQVTYGRSEEEASCLVCGWSRSSNTFAPFPAALAKLQDQHKSILQQIRIFLKNVKGTSRTKGKKGHTSTNMTIRYFTRLRKLLAEHQRVEERVLIPIVDKYLDSCASETMRREHTEIWKALEQLNGKLLRVNDSDESRRSFLESATELEVMAREQFSREENVIYWFASLCLSQSDEGSIG